MSSRPQHRPRRATTRRHGGLDPVVARVLLGVVAMVLAGVVVLVTRSAEALVGVSAFLVSATTMIHRVVRR